MLEKILPSLGLDEDEIKTYMTLLEVGPSTVGALAKRMGVPRASLYGFLERLHGRGLVNQSLNMNDIKLFSPESPEKILLIFEEKLENLQKQRTDYQALLPELLTQRATKLLKPTFHIFEGEDGLKHVLKDMLLYSDLETQAFWPIKAMVDILSPAFFRYHNKERIKNKLYTRAIWPQNQAVEIGTHPYLGVGEKFLREIRIAPNEIDFTMGYWIYGNKAAFVSSRKESFGFIIESAELVQMLLTQFEMLWNVSKPLVVDVKVTEKFVKELERYDR